MSNEDLVNKIERSLWMLIDSSTTVGRLEVRDDIRGYVKPIIGYLPIFVIA